MDYFLGVRRHLCKYLRPESPTGPMYLLPHTLLQNYFYGIKPTSVADPDPDPDPVLLTRVMDPAPDPDQKL
jgi:hypothetical protein